MKRSFILYALVAILVIISGIKILNNRHRSQALQTAPVAQILDAEVYIARDTVIHFQLKAIGSLRPNERVEIRSEVSQRIVSIHFREGSLVEKNALLFKLDDAILQAELKRISIQEELAAQNEFRSRVMLERGGLSEQVYDETLYALRLLRAEKGKLEAEITKTEIRAPFRGYLGLRNFSVGAYTSPADVFTVLEDISTLKLDFTIPERHASNVKKGQAVAFKVVGIADDFNATVTAMQPAVNDETRALLVRAVCDNTGRQLIPGTSVKATLDLQQTTKSIFIPTQCLVPSTKGYSVFILRHGTVASNPVKTDLRTNQQVQILEGISPGDTVIMTNLLRIKPGSKLNITKIF
ncbi:MAG: efflux RND transporter periplasmic adaptor subunit [Bacteroidales bacterium]|nr:efflux RND transporter periplasmic adaptor subunit [Bacteroidales bacterium]MDZ4203350.1 efflux RND transporter periplasmic adaptor subunit [Bacteroidales bacterium]